MESIKMEKTVVATVIVDGQSYTKEQLATRIRGIKDEHMKAWEFLHSLVSAVGMPGGDAIFFRHPIKSPSIEVYDNIGFIASEVIDRMTELEELEK
jgi:hypothetical protein